MTQLNISFEEAKKLSLVELTWFKDRNWNAKVQGGFIRDSFLGAPVKDMDIFITPRDEQTHEMIEAVAKEFYEARGHAYILHKKIRRPDAPEDSPYNEFLTVFQSQDVAEGDFPVDLIFTPAGYDHPGSFDIGICEHQFWVPAFAPDTVHHHMSREAKRDIENKTLTILRAEDGLFEMMNGYRELTDEQFEKAVARMKAHVERVQAKYPDYTVVVDISPAGFGRGQGRLHERLKEENFFGNTGPLLPSEASIAERDAVRQLDREELVRIVRGEDPGAPVQGGEAAVPRGARLQPGLFDLPDNEFLNRVLETARANRNNDRIFFGVEEVAQAPDPTPEPITPIRAARNARRATPAPRNTGPRDAFGNLR